MKKKFNGSKCAYRVFYLHILRRIAGGGESPPSQSLRYQKKRGPERVNTRSFLNLAFDNKVGKCCKAKFIFIVIILLELKCDKSFQTYSISAIGVLIKSFSDWIRIQSNFDRIRKAQLYPHSYFIRWFINTMRKVRKLY